MIVFTLIILLTIWDIVVLNAEKRHYIHYQDEFFVDDGVKITKKQQMQQYQECMHQVKHTNKQ